MTRKLFRNLWPRSLKFKTKSGRILESFLVAQVERILIRQSKIMSGETSMDPVQETLKLKSTALDTWYVKEQLVLASTVLKSGSQVVNVYFTTNKFFDSYF